ncbi:hypothetical protein GYMLUDRAFT_253335 [Collybiopsis luxurians FD-317 M1]|uniref:Uncharacterized protein n=1 Tax=Collybiopsis luxurians FD-317 M1 TaxID=944289 RepID=A0A0D0BKT3_9AGAR|nr:hypothetical protein GYMLUDRAFT_253335 [Collybiopsis luxurians FD-317 M1]
MTLKSFVLFVTTLFSHNFYAAPAAFEQQPFAVEEIGLTSPNSGLHALATEANTACGDIGDSCVVSGCCDWALCSPYNYQCHAKVPWSRDQLAPPTYKTEDVRIKVGDRISFEVYRRHDGGVFQGYLTQLEGVSVNNWTEVTVTTDQTKRAIFNVTQADAKATRLATVVSPSANPPVYKLMINDKTDWVYINGDLNDTSTKTQLNFVKGTFPADGKQYHALWFASTMRVIKKSALNIDSDGEGNVKDSGYTAYLQVIKET